MKKCIVLDLDNTLWGGIVGEDGPDGIQLSLKAPGNSFLAFQQAILDYHDRGVILAINSRNNPEDALGVIRSHPDMLLREKNFAAMRINWNDKAANIRELADELNIGLDSMVFLDDDPVNRASVRAQVPDVTVPEMPEDPAQYAGFLHDLKLFGEGLAATDEDTMRTNMYVTERLRREDEKSYATKEEFLTGLGLVLSIRTDEDALPRLAQLSEKTNQFNTDKQPFSEDELRAFMRDPEAGVYYGKLRDRFGDYGIIVSAVVEKSADRWHIRSLLMSCRVFGRGVEDAFMAALASSALSEGAERLSIAVRETEKNAPAREYVARAFGASLDAPAEAFTMPAWIDVRYE